MRPKLLKTISYFKSMCLTFAYLIAINVTFITSSSWGLDTITVNGKVYKLNKFLGGGGVGSGYSATRESDDKQVFIKVIKQELPEERKFILNRIKELSQKNPYMATIFDIGEIHGNLCVVGELTRGRSIFFYIDKFVLTLNDPEKPELTNLEIRDRVVLLERIFKQLMSFIRSLHKEGFVFRDFNVENILFDIKTEKIKIIDPLDTMGILGEKASEIIEFTDMGTEKSHQNVVYHRGMDYLAVAILMFKLMTGALPIIKEQKKDMEVEWKQAIKEISKKVEAMAAENEDLDVKKEINKLQDEKLRELASKNMELLKSVVVDHLQGLIVDMESLLLPRFFARFLGLVLYIKYNLTLDHSNRVHKLKTHFREITDQVKKDDLTKVFEDLFSEQSVKKNRCFQLFSFQ